MDSECWIYTCYLTSYNLFTELTFVKPLQLNFVCFCQFADTNITRIKDVTVSIHLMEPHR